MAIFDPIQNQVYERMHAQVQEFLDHCNYSLNALQIPPEIWKVPLELQQDALIRETLTKFTKKGKQLSTM